MLVDLHMHTYYSDGTFSPREIAIKGKEKNVGIMAVTDHNRIGAWEEFSKAAKENGIIPIKGVEINAKFQNQVLHILGYGFEDTEELLAVLKHADDEMEQMSRDLIINLAKVDAQVSIED